ncbi:MAG: ABC transporter ATP-binding protein [Hyphomicrobiaceae bacterium]
MAEITGAVSIRVDAKTFPATAGRPPLEVLRDVEINVEPGSFVVITGPSGCGKSTLLNVVSGLDHDYKGRVSLGGGDPLLSFMFQSPRLLPWRTVEENIALVMDDDDPKLAKIPEMLASVGLEGLGNVYPERLSLGMQRRAALARAFIVDPDILLMDEPFVSLDDPTAQSLRQLLIDLWNRSPTTVLFVTHDRMESVMLGTRLIRVGGNPATIVQDTSIDLSRDQRGDPEAVRAAQERIFADVV